MRNQWRKQKNLRRAAKSSFTRSLNAGRILLDSCRPPLEVRHAFDEVKAAHDNLIAKHEKFTMYLTDEEYPEAQHWMEDCTLRFVEFAIRVNDYCKDKDKEVNAASVVNVSEQETHGSQEHEVEAVNENEGEQSGAANQKSKSGTPLVMKHEKPKMLMLYGDGRKYFIFKADFQHAVEKYYSERDAISILRSCLRPEPAKLVEGISTDLKSAWNYLDQNYGDPRIVSDVVTSDIERFKAVQTGEVHRFCDLVNLVRRSYNILKEVKGPQDIDNTRVISLIERKMTKDDVKIWARYIQSLKLEPSMRNLLKWMDEEMTARFRSGATISKTGTTTRPSVNSLDADGNGNSSSERDKNQKQCHACKVSHYVGECRRFKAMTPSERW